MQQPVGCPPFLPISLSLFCVIAIVAVGEDAGDLISVADPIVALRQLGPLAIAVLLLLGKLPLHGLIRLFNFRRFLCPRNNEFTATT